MTYYLTIHRPADRNGSWFVGPFPTHIAAQHWAESHALDEWDMERLWDPAEAGGRAAGIQRERAGAGE
jgi:hypothetical protein